MFKVTVRKKKNVWNVAWQNGIEFTTIHAAWQKKAFENWTQYFEFNFVSA